MRTPYRSPEQFREKAAVLADALSLDDTQALEALAHISGYEQPYHAAQAAPDTAMLSSREELMARLQALYPGIANEEAGAVIDRLALPVRETDMGRFARSPDAAPNISG